MYKRIILKLSGETLAPEKVSESNASHTFDAARVDRAAKAIVALHDLGAQVGVVMGGGNIWRGRFTAEGMEAGLKQGAKGLYETASAISDETAEALSGISSHRVSLSGAHSTNYGDRLDRLLDAVERLADSQTTMEIDGRPFGRLVRSASGAR